MLIAFWLLKILYKVCCVKFDQLNFLFLVLIFTWDVPNKNDTCQSFINFA